MTKLKQEDCYLVKSGAIPLEELKQENNLDGLYQALEDPEFSDDWKTTFRDFFIPYEISFIKFSLNREYIKRTEFDFIYRYYKSSPISPSLEKIDKITNQKGPDGFPGWFVPTFPDVTLWTMKEDQGGKLFSEKYQGVPEEELFRERGFLKDHILIDLIELYIQETGKPVECSIFIES